MSKHTPGPWKAVYREQTNDSVIKGKTVIKGQWADAIATVHTNATPSDAHLIAAAPELLEALESLHAVARRRVPDYEESEFAKICAVALKKARGEE